MKKNQYICALLVMLLGITACENYLDVNPKGKLAEDEMFEDIEGYRSAMYGVYASLAKKDLYGKVLSYGFLDELAQLYYSPYEFNSDNIKEVTTYKYKDLKVVDVVNNIWKKGYACISYVNNILAHIEKEDLNSETDFPYMLGECHGLRAFIHFDILRLFADNILLKQDASGIPYAYDYDLQNKQVFSLKDSYTNILNDLTKAESILEECELNNKTTTPTSYQTDRYTQMNIYAVYALKARVYQAMGDNQNARNYAEKVITAPEFQLITPSSENLKAVMKFPANNELIWGLFNNTLYSTLYDDFISTDIVITPRRVREDLTDIYNTKEFQPTSQDYRYQAFFRPSSRTMFIRLLEKAAEVDEDITKIVLGVNLIRLPEMYYIAAEGWYDEKPEKAIRYLNDVRNSRGLADIDNSKVNQKEKFMEIMRNERIRELWGEGQIFLDYKRYNVEFNDLDMNPIKPSPEIFNLPWPETELEYGSTFKK